MAEITIHREHSLGLPSARKAAFQWAEKAESDLSMVCEYEEGTSADKVTFKRSGVEGTLDVTATRFELHAKLGFLVGAFKDRIQGEIEKNLDTMLAGAAKPKTSKSAPKPAKKRA